MTRDKLIEAAQKALDDIAGKAGGCPGLTPLDYCDDTQCGCQETMVSALNAAFAAIPGLADVLDGKAVIVPVPVDDAMVSAGTYTLADHLCASEYVNGPDASVVLALAHKGFVSALDAAFAASPYRKERT